MIALRIMNLLRSRARGLVVAAFAATTLAGTVATTAAAQGGGANRPQLERQVRQRLAEMVQTRLQLTDDQMRKLEATNRKFEPRRMQLLESERSARRELRDQLEAGDRADQKQVGALVDQLLTIQDQRLDLVRQEQRDLGAFLTPVQRAKYLVLQDQLRRRVEEMRGRGRGGPPRGRPGGPGPGR